MFQLWKIQSFAKQRDGTPFLALKDWQAKKPKLFVKRVYDQMGLDTLAIFIVIPYPEFISDCLLNQINSVLA